MPYLASLATAAGPRSTSSAILLLVVATTSVIVAPTAFAEGPLTDAKGDVVAHVNEQPAPAPSPETPHTQAADLIGLHAEEDLTSFVLTLALASMQQPPPRAFYAIEYTWADARYRILIEWRNLPSEPPLLMADLQMAMGEGEDYMGMSELEFTQDASAGALSIKLPKSLIVTMEGHAPVKGDEIVDLKVTSRLEAAPNLVLSDAMPNSGTGKLPITIGGEGTGSLMFEAADPVRVSNGGATTFVYQAHLRNAAERDDDVSLTIADLPEGWSARVPGVVQVPAQSEKPVFAVVSIPFGHEHGGFSGFDIQAKSNQDPASTARVRFGVLHTPVPMPAGHHSEVYLHAASSNTGAAAQVAPHAPPSMNTLSEHGRDAKEATPTSVSGLVEWRIPLGPALQMGLDFDLNRTGAIEGSIFGRQSGAGRLEARLILGREMDEAAVLAEAAPLDVTLEPQNPTPFTFTLAPTPESDYIAYEPGVNMILILRLATNVPTPPASATHPTLDVASFKMTLPLNEFHDRLTLRPEDAPSTLKLVTTSAVEKEARPGTTAAFLFDLKNAGAAPERVMLEAAGNDARLATFAPSEPFSLQPGESRRITLGVAVPASAANDERLDVVLLARSEKDPSNLAIAHTVTIVSKGAASPDERAVVDAAQERSKETPFPLALLLAAGAIVALSRRRDR